MCAKTVVEQPFVCEIHGLQSNAVSSFAKLAITVRYRRAELSRWRFSGTPHVKLYRNTRPGFLTEHPKYPDTFRISKPSSPPDAEGWKQTFSGFVSLTQTPSEQHDQRRVGRSSDAQLLTVPQHRDCPFSHDPVIKSLLRSARQSRATRCCLHSLGSRFRSASLISQSDQLEASARRTVLCSEAGSTSPPQYVESYHRAQFAASQTSGWSKSLVTRTPAALTAWAVEHPSVALTA